MIGKTISEQLFEQFCDNNQLKYDRIETESRSGKRTPDYEVHTGGSKVIAEIKQFDPNDEEVRIYEQLRDRGWTDAYGGEPGAKVRRKIQSGAKQLKARSRGQFPTLLVLYNNVPISYRGVHPYEVKTAMYGIEKVVLIKGDAPGQARVADRGFGPKRRVTPTWNTSLSAVGTLREASDDEVYLAVYHNIYASIPLPTAWLQSSRIYHYTIEEKKVGKFQEWVRCDVHT